MSEHLSGLATLQQKLHDLPPSSPSRGSLEGSIADIEKLKSQSKARQRLVDRVRNMIIGACIGAGFAFAYMKISSPGLAGWDKAVAGGAITGLVAGGLLPLMKWREL